MRQFGPDFYNITQLLSEEELLIQQTAYEFVQTEFMPLINKHFDNATFPMEMVPKLGELGFMGSSLPEESGGAGISNVAYGLILLELERGDSGLRSFASVQGALVMYPIHAYGSDEQKNKWLKGLGTGEKIGCFGLTEPNHGSDPNGMETTATFDPGTNEFILNGSKNWITNSPIADIFVIWARNTETRQIRGYLIERGTPGLDTPQIEGKFSLRASSTGMIFMDNVRIPKDNEFPIIAGLKGPFGCLNNARYGIAWGVLGAAESCMNTARDYTLDRKQFGQPLAGEKERERVFVLLLVLNFERF